MEVFVERTVHFGADAIEIIQHYYPSIEAFLTFRTPYVRDFAIGK